MKKILFVNASLAGGGSERVMCLLANKFAQLGYEVDMIILLRSEAVYEVDERVRCHQLTEYTGAIKMRFGRFNQMRRLFRQINPDVIISFMYNVNTYTLLAGAGLNKRMIVSERANPLVRKFIYKHIERAIYKLADKVVFQTEFAKKCYNASIQKKGIVIPNPINIENDVQTDINTRRKSIMCIGRMSRQKNFEMAINAFGKFVAEFPEYTLDIFGKGPLMQELKEQCSRLEITDKVNFRGYVNNISDYMKKAGMYVSSSNFEGISNAMLEAMAMGVPSVCTDCPVGGAAMVIENNVNGILIPVGDEAALYEAMCHIAGDREFAEKIACEAVRVRERFSLDSVIKDWIKIVEDK